jgi:hypothetical protein
MMRLFVPALLVIGIVIALFLLVRAHGRRSIDKWRRLSALVGMDAEFGLATRGSLRYVVPIQARLDAVTQESSGLYAHLRIDGLGASYVDPGTWPAAEPHQLLAYLSTQDAFHLDDIRWVHTTDGRQYEW